MSVLHSSEAGDHVSHMVAPPQYMQVVHHPSMIHNLYPSHSSGKKTHTHNNLVCSVLLILRKQIVSCLRLFFSFFSFNFICPVSRHINIQSYQVTAYLFLQSPLDNGYCFEVGLYKVLICSQCIQNSTWPKFGEADSSTATERCGDEVRSRTHFNHLKERIIYLNAH